MNKRKMNKWLLVIRGDGDLRGEVLRELNSAFNSNLDHARAVTLTITPHQDRNNFRAMVTTVKKRIKQHLLHGSETVFILDAPNEHPNHWLPITNIAEMIKTPFTVIGVDLCKYKRDELAPKNNKTAASDDIFMAAVYKYYRIDDAEHIATVVQSILQDEGYETNVC